MSKFLEKESLNSDQFKLMSDFLIYEEIISELRTDLSNHLTGGGLTVALDGLLQDSSTKLRSKLKIVVGFSGVKGQEKLDSSSMYYSAYEPLLSKLELYEKFEKEALPILKERLLRVELKNVKNHLSIHELFDLALSVDGEDRVVVGKDNLAGVFGIFEEAERRRKDSLRQVLGI